MLDTIDNPMNLVRDALYHLNVRDDDYDNLIGAGMLGLAKAIKNYDPTRAKFITYAYQRIQGEILDSLKSIPEYSRAQHKRLYNLVSLDTATSKLLIEPNLLLIELKEALAKLSKLELIIITKHYGNGLNLTEIGNELGFTQSRISQLHKSAIEKLQKEMK